RATFPPSHRLSGRLQFARVFEAKVRQSRGPLTIYACPNSLDHPRIGISISRRVGTAPQRNRIKRRLREAYRLQRHDLPGGYDLVIVVRPHRAMPLERYSQALFALANSLAGLWREREKP